MRLLRKCIRRLGGVQHHSAECVVDGVCFRQDAGPGAGIAIEVAAFRAGVVATCTAADLVTLCGVSAIVGVKYCD